MSDRRYRSMFWPIILISVGLVWFLGNINVIPGFNPLLLLNLWPLLLIALGLDIIFARKSPLAGLLIGLVTVGAALAILLAAPNMGWMGVNNGQYITERFTEVLGSATSASLEVHGASQPVTVTALQDSTNLFEGEIGHSGKMDFVVSGSTQKSISLRRAPDSSSFVLNFGFSGLNLNWTIGLSPKIPLALVFDGGSGRIRLDLRGLQVVNLDVNSGSGGFEINLPVGEKPYSVNYNGGSGSLTLDLPANTDLTLTLHGGSGSMNLRLPPDAAVRLDVNDNGSGSINVPGKLSRVSGKASEDQGSWQTSGFDTARNKIIIVVKDFGSGSLNIR